MKTILVTGATDGIGRETAKELAEKGHRIIIHGRSENKAWKVKEELNKINSEVEHKIAIADLESQQQVLDLSTQLKEEEDKIDVLINNAGIYQNQLEFSEDKIEKTIAVNYHSHFVLTLLLLPLLEKSDDPRIINFSSMVHAHNLDTDKIWDPINFNGSQAYSDSKLAMILFTFKLDRIVNGITVNCLHPGVINTKLLRQGWGAGGSSVEKGAVTPVYLALSDEVKGESGGYFVNKNKKKPTEAAFKQELQDQLWNKSIEMIKYQEILNKIPDQFLN
ncbi:NAD(P)-dependent dehydrogenase (short-subunit alcohol dehydrogenase family) [Halanaerobium saccharolyticum]|uniref:NAD(P)-dependent dehydrogenase (Short-subunit alcohol dehydrogenase family) n=1 Tax=Halanaerobium saccharolyticum TaxID=43595 RepID=A0A4V6PTN8_9FIRM|nr:SDR family NAD(P)-dependent oxidoreductase [Halanaerobium saccharolyticum]TDO92013.1 NAD(P)-dependent dehydrogenase (short-subunit alcohol dehydrogenase family) [Halanaerobium saccharolyticum]